MNTLHYGRRTYEIPGEWNELTGRQLAAVMEVFHAKVEVIKGHLMLLRILAKIPWWRFFTMRNPNMLAAAMEATGFLMEKNTLTKNLFPEYRGLCGPADALVNLKMAEFCFTELFFMAWRNTSDEAQLNKLVAVLYRPRRKNYDHRLNPDGDHRVPFNPNLIDHYEARVKHWPLAVRQSIAHFYDGSRQQKIEQNPRVFDGAGGDESLYGMWSVMRNVAKGGHFGDFEKVGDQYIDTILMELNEVVVEAERMEAEMKKQRQ